MGHPTADPAIRRICGIIGHHAPIGSVIGGGINVRTSKTTPEWR